MFQRKLLLSFATVAASQRLPVRPVFTAPFLINKAKCIVDLNKWKKSCRKFKCYSTVDFVFIKISPLKISFSRWLQKASFLFTLLAAVCPHFHLCFFIAPNSGRRNKRANQEANHQLPRGTQMKRKTIPLRKAIKKQQRMRKQKKALQKHRNNSNSTCFLCSAVAIPPRLKTFTGNVLQQFTNVVGFFLI